MQRMIIVGAGGLGREVEALARNDYANGKDWYLGGFLDTRPEVLAAFAMKISVIGDPTTFVPEPNDIFIVAIGDTRFKRKVVAPLRLKGANFVSLRTNVQISPRAKFGTSVFCDHATLSVDATVGDFAFIGADTIIGHDAVVGDYSHIGARCFIAGRARIGEGATVDPMACIAMDVRVGEGSVVGLGSVVFNEVPAGATVVGNPARRLDPKRS
jgi:sugar O-acyltransferase (sialic acid O-acetyltransferase NeuD family)